MQHVLNYQALKFQTYLCGRSQKLATAFPQKKMSQLTIKISGQSLGADNVAGRTRPRNRTTTQMLV